MPQSIQLNLAGPFPPKGAGEALKERMVGFLQSEEAAPGERFLTETEVVARSGLSRSTVRRAMDDLQREGWVERQVGRGTFVGPRAEFRQPSAGVQTKSRSRATGMRIGVFVGWQGSPVSDWYSPSVLRGIEAALEGTSASVDLLNASGESPDRLRERLEESPPDVLVCLAGNLKQILVIRDAQRLGIPIICTGSGQPELGLIRVTEDNPLAVHQAYDHLIEHGHERIGLVLPMQAHNFVFDRLHAFRERRDQHNRFIASDVLWLNPRVESKNLVEEANRVLEYVDTFGYTAVISGSAETSRILGYTACHLDLSIPEQLSMVSFDQSPEMATWMGLPAPTMVAIPLDKIGREIARCAKQLRDKQPVESALIPCELVPGETVADLNQP